MGIVFRGNVISYQYFSKVYLSPPVVKNRQKSGSMSQKHDKQPEKPGGRPPGRKQNGVLDDHGERKQSVSANEPDENWQCSQCKTDINSDTDKALECSMCDDKFCTTCINMTTKEYTSLQTLDRDDIFWLCSSCITMINDIKNNRTQSVSNKNDFDNLKHEIGS